MLGARGRVLFFVIFKLKLHFFVLIINCKIMKCNICGFKNDERSVDLKNDDL